MILTRLHIENFRQFFGSNELTFAKPGPKNVTVIVGTNGAGKTTLLNAITWCLYEKIRQPLAEGIYSSRAAEQLLPGSTGQVLVELTFEAKQRVHRVRRVQRFRKKEDGAIERVGATAFELYEVTESGETLVADDPAKVVEQLVPEGLSHFFFFRGEDMEDLAAPEDDEDRLRVAVETFLELKILDRAGTHLKKAGEKLEKLIRDNATGSTLVLSEDIAREEAELEDLKAKLDNLQREQRAAKSIELSLEKKLAEVDQLRPFVEAKAEATVRLDERLPKVRLLERELAETISKDAYLTLGDDIFATVERLAEDAVRSGELPAKIKPRFVDDLLESGSCICGRSLEAGSRAALAAFRGATGVADFEAAIADVRNAVATMRDRKDAFEAAYEDRRRSVLDERQAIRALNARISEMTSRLEGSPITADEIQALQRSYTKAHEDLTNLRLTEATVNEGIRHKEERLRDLKLEREAESAGVDLVGRLERRRSSADRVRNVVASLRDKWCDVVRSYLDVKLKETWGQITQLERVVEFNEDFDLTISEQSSQGVLVRSAPSQANLRALALSFIGALISLAREVDEYVQANPDDSRAFYRGGVYGLVMDAPFATMDVHFKQRLPQGLISLVPQVVLITSYDQWEGVVKDVMAPAVGKAFVLELHNPRCENEVRVVQVLTRPVPYEIGEPAEPNDWSIVREAS